MIVDQFGVFLEDLVLASLGGMLQLVDGFGVEQVKFTLASPLVFTTSPQIAVRYLLGVVEIREAVTQCHLFGDDVESDSA